MRHRYRPELSEGPMFGIGGPLLPGVRNLLIANGGVFLLVNVLARSSAFFDWLGLSSWGVLHGRVWQVATYSFLHRDFLHLLFNMFYLFMFGGVVERTWGTARFLRYYFITAIGAGLVWTIVQAGSPTVTIGASGAVYAVLLAFAVLFPDAPVLLLFVLPIRAKYLVAFLIGIEVLYLIPNKHDGVAHLIHLAGAAIGFFLIRRGISLSPLLNRYRRWRLRRRLAVIDYRELMKFNDEGDDRPGGKRGGV